MMTIFIRIGSFIFCCTLINVFVACASPRAQQPLVVSQPASQTPPPSLMQDVVVHSSLSTQVDINPAPGGMPGERGLGYVRPEERTLPIEQRSQNYEFQLTSTNKFSPFLILVNKSTMPKTFLVTTILDYRQVPFTLDNQHGLLHLVEIPANKETNIPISLTITGRGLHDIQVVAFEDPFNLSLDINYRVDIHGKVAARRTTAVVDDSQTPARPLEVLDVGVVPPVKGKPTFDVMFLRRSKESTEMIPPPQRTLVYTDTVPLGAPYPLQVAFASRGEEVTRVYAFVPFLNYHQVALDGKDVFVVRLAPEEEAAFNADVVLPHERGVHQLQMVYLVDPYTNLLQGTLTNPLVLGSLRVAFDVR